MKFDLSDSGLTPIQKEWNLWMILLSYGIAITGSHCVTQIMEQWRSARVRRNKKEQNKLMFLASCLYGGGAIWAMHFIGSGAFQLHDPEDSSKTILLSYDGGIALLMLPFAISCSFLGLKIAAKDAFFKEVDDSARKQLLVRFLQYLTY